VKGAPIPKIGYFGWKTWELAFDNCRLPGSALIGEEGRAFYYISAGLERARAHTAARSIGLARGALEDATAYVAAHKAAVDSFGNRDYKVFGDIRKMSTLSPECTALFETAKKYSNARPNFRGSAIWIASSVIVVRSNVRRLVHELVRASMPKVAVLSYNEIQPAHTVRTAAVVRSNLRRSRDRFEHFLEKACANPEFLARLDDDPALVESAVDIFEHSQYFADQLIRNPDLISELSPAGEAPVGGAESAQDAGEMRRAFSRAMLRIQGESILCKVPIFTTLERTSDLADTVVSTAYRLALAQVLAASPPASAAYTPADQMMVIALGRLGMREFDLASDADLCFVIPDVDASERLFWTAVAERMIDAMVASLETHDGKFMGFLLDICWCRFTRHGWYESGSWLLECVPSPAEESQPGESRLRADGIGRPGPRVGGG
jgi:glutamine synthetase adenylyltransferase